MMPHADYFAGLYLILNFFARDDLFNTNASIVATLAKAAAKVKMQNKPKYRLKSYFN